MEPVFGTLTQYMGLRKVNVRGIDGANKCMLMAGAAYNIKKLLKFLGKSTKTEAKAVAFVFWLKKVRYHLINFVLSSEKSKIRS
ncbi:transposase [Tenacibaculum tangerinum]|nr:transposase [Tenacibaculum tangerinum]